MGVGRSSDLQVCVWELVSVIPTRWPVASRDEEPFLGPEEEQKTVELWGVFPSRTPLYILSGKGSPILADKESGFHPSDLGGPRCSDGGT